MEQGQQSDGAPPEEAAGPAPYGPAPGGSTSAASACSSCDAYLQGQCPSNQLLFHVCKLRTGTRSEKEEAARQLGEFAKESAEMRRQVINCGSLPSLLALVTLPPPWEGVALAAAKAAAYTIPGVEEAAIVLRYSHAILDALKLLLTTAGAAGGGGANSNGDAAGCDAGEQQAAALPAGEGRCHYRHLVARVLAHMIVIIKHEWRAATADQPSTSASFLAWTTSHTTASTTIQDSLESVVEIAMMLAEGEKGCSGGNGNGSNGRPQAATGEGQDATVLTAFSIAQMAHIEGSRVLLVNRGLLPILERWLASPVKDLQRHGASIFASLCQRSHPQGGAHSQAGAAPVGAVARRRSGEPGTTDGRDVDTLIISNDLDVYTRGYIDAKIVSSPDLLPCLLPLASSPETEVRLHVAEALADLSLQPQNRQAVVRSGGVSSLVLLLEEAGGDLATQGEVAEHALRALYYLAMDQDGASGSGGAGANGGAGGAGSAGGGSRSPCLLIAKEGGLTPLVAILRSVALQQRPVGGELAGASLDGGAEQGDEALSGAILSNAIAFLAIMSQHCASRVAMFQAPGLVENVLAVGIHALWQVEQGPTAGPPQQQQQQQQQQQLVMASSSAGKAKGLPQEEQAGPEGGGHLRGAALQAVHLAYTLANLAACGEGSYARGLVEAGAVPVLLQMCRCRVPEVVDQAARGLALCCRPLTRGFAVAPAVAGAEADAASRGGGVEKPPREQHRPLAPLRSLEETQDEQLRLLWANEALQTLLALLAAHGSSPVVRLEAVKGLAALARVPDFGVQIVRGGALCDLLKLAVDSTSAGQKQLAGAAEEALVALGVEGGSKALEVCGNDRSLLLDWWGMERSLEEQREAQAAELGFAVEAIMDSDADGAAGHGGLSNSASGSGAAHAAAIAGAASPSAYPRWVGGGGGGSGPLYSPGSAVVPRATALCGSGSGAGSSGSGSSGSGGGGGPGGLVGAGLGGLGGIIKEVANLRLRDLLTMCLAPGSAALPGTSGAGPGGAGAAGAGASSSLSLSGSGRQSSLQEGVIDAIPAALQPLPFRGAISSGGAGGAGNNSGGGSSSRRETLLSALIQTARRQPSADSYALAEQERARSRLPYEPCLTSPLAIPEVGALTFNMQRLMDRYFPSRLLQQEVVPLLALGKAPGTGEWVRADGGVGGGVGSRGNGGSGQQQGAAAVRFEAARAPHWRAVQMPTRTYFSFRREGRVLSKILKRHGQEADLWSLSFVNSTFEGEWAVSFLEKIHLLPKVRSLLFITTPGQRAAPDFRPSPDTSLAYLVGGLPSFIRFLSFDGCLSRDKLVILSHILKTKSLGGGRGRGAAGGQQQGLALYGLAIRNHGHLRPDDFLPLLAFFRHQPEDGAGGSLAASRSSANLAAQVQQQQPQDEAVITAMAVASSASTDPSASANGGAGSLLSRQPSLLGYVGLRFLDLAGNKLGDPVSAEVIRAVSHSPSVTAVDLSGNGIKNGQLFLDAVAEHIAGALGGVWLRTLLLDDNALSPKAVIRLVALLDGERSLEVLSLAANGLADGKPLNEALRALLRRPKGALVELSLAHNRLGTEAGRELLFGLLENQSLRFLRLRGNAMQAQELDLIERQLAGNRRRFYAPLLGGVGRGSAGRHGAAGARVAGGVVSNGEEDGPYGAQRAAWAQPGQQPGQVNGAVAAPLEHHRSRSEPAAAASLAAGPSQPTQGPHQHKSMTRPPPLPEFERVLVDVDGEEIGAAGPLQPPPVTPGGSSALSEDALNNAARSPLLSVLFSAPLAWRDVNGDLHAVEALWFDRERELLTQALAEAGADIELRFDYATTDRLRSAVTLGARALHYSGHGHKNQLTFEDGCGGLQLVAVDTLRHLCAAGAHHLDLVVVSSCYSALAAQAFIDAGVRHCVCINLESSITDAAALAFTKAFYLCLAVGGSVQHAFDIGRQAVAAAPNVPNSHVETQKFLLLPEDQDHHFSPFPPQPLSAPPSLSGSRSLALQSSWALLQDATHYLPTPPEDFLGREVLMYRAINACLNRRLVTLLGVAGIGKSALAAAVCRYMGVRRNIPDGIVFVRLQGKHTLDEMIQAIIQGVARQLPSATSAASSSSSSSAAGQAAMPANGPPPTPPALSSGMGMDAAPLERDEEWLFARLRSQRVLLVLDHMQELQASQDGINAKIFLSQLFDQTRYVKVMVTTTRPLDLHTLPGAGVGESLVSVGPLNFRSTVRLFSRLCPHLHTARDRRVLLESLVWPEDQAEVTINSRDVSPRTCAILEKLGEGVPGRILKRAYEMGENEVLVLLEESQEARRQEEAAALSVATAAMAMREGNGGGVAGVAGAGGAKGGVY